MKAADVDDDGDDEDDVDDDEDDVVVFTRLSPASHSRAGIVARVFANGAIGVR